MKNSDHLYFFILQNILLRLHIYAGEIHVAVTSGDIGKVKAILESDDESLELTDESSSTPFHLACLKNQIVVANYLIDKGANVNACGC